MRKILQIYYLFPILSFHLFVICIFLFLFLVIPKIPLRLGFFEKSISLTIFYNIFMFLFVKLCLRLISLSLFLFMNEGRVLLFNYFIFIKILWEKSRNSRGFRLYFIADFSRSSFNLFQFAFFQAYFWLKFFILISKLNFLLLQLKTASPFIIKFLKHLASKNMVFSDGLYMHMIRFEWCLFQLFFRPHWADLMVNQWVFSSEFHKLP